MAAKAVETPPVEIPDEKPPANKPADPPAEPKPDEAGDLENPNEKKRQSMWSDAVAKLSRRIKAIEDSQVAGTVWTLPAILAMSAVAVALLVSFSAIYFVFNGIPRGRDD